MRFTAVVAAIVAVILLVFLVSGGMAARPMVNIEKTTAVPVVRKSGVVVESWTMESSSLPSGCTNGNGAGGYCRPPAPAGH
uniref:Uncharacterized protein n=1 Tax=Oryza glaberrima TaxID=4538 RepID=I1Q8M1_ORYGL